MISPGCARRGPAPSPSPVPTHAERRVLPYTPAQMFDLVADIERYPEFLPWCTGVRVRERRDAMLVADLLIGFKLFRERFTSRVDLDRDNFKINVTYTDGPLKRLDNHWIFESDGKGGCVLDFFIDFEFQSRPLQAAMSVLFNEAVRRMVAAFERRADQLYGAAGAAKAHR
jgi:coenzyme Q-binding protein COQ10